MLLALVLSAFFTPPNVIYILADDLGYGEVGSYGQDKIETPNLDRLAAEGMRFTQHYSGSPVCAPSRCVLLTGLHTGHSFIRANREMGGWERGAREGQLHLPAGTVTLPALLRQRGYVTGAFGKWGLGGPETTGHPNAQGFDHYFGVLCQRIAHNHYPEHLWRNGDMVVLENGWFSAHQRIETPLATPDAYFQAYARRDYAPDLMTEEALAFIRRQADEPFFLYYASPIPHVALQVPRDVLERYVGRWDETPYLGERGYLPHPWPRSAYAAMVTHLDRDVGRIVDLVDELGLGERTLVVFSSDNGATFNGGTDSGFFESTGGLRGLKTTVWEGGIRVPMIARWTGHVEAGAVTDHVSAFQDVLPTVVELAGGTPPEGIDGISFAPTLLGGTQPRHEHLYWEYVSQQALRLGDWKGVRPRLRSGDLAIELYDLALDPAETTDVAAEHPEIVERILAIMRDEHLRSAEFPLAGIDE